jgi:hypothetical protein
MNNVPKFLRHVRLSKADETRFADIMSGWGKTFHHMKQIKQQPSNAQVTELEKMLVFELMHERRLLILTRLLGRYKITLGADLHNQLFAE